MNEISRKPYRLVPLSECILYKLYIAHVADDEHDSYSIEQIKTMFQEDVSRKLVRSAIEFLGYSAYRRDKIKRHGRAGNYSFSITDEGILEVERQLRRSDSVAAYLHANPDASLELIAGLDGIFRTAEERADLDAWAPLEIDRESADYRETVEAVEEAYEAIRADNGLAATHPEQRTGILGSIADGIEVLKKKAPSAQQLRALILLPLEWVSVTFSKTLIGEAAKKAAEKLVQFLISLLN